MIQVKWKPLLCKKKKKKKKKKKNAKLTIKKIFLQVTDMWLNIYLYVH